MALYESVLLVRQEASNERAEEVVSSYAEMIQQSGGKVVNRESWGLRGLAFPIRKGTKAHYALLRLDAPHEAVESMEGKLRYDKEVIRYLTLRVKAHGESPSPMVPRRREEGDEREERRGSRDRERERRPRGARGSGGGKAAAAERTPDGAPTPAESAPTESAPAGPAPSPAPEEKA